MFLNFWRKKAFVLIMITCLVVKQFLSFNKLGLSLPCLCLTDDFLSCFHASLVTGEHGSLKVPTALTRHVHPLLVSSCNSALCVLYYRLIYMEHLLPSSLNRENSQWKQQQLLHPVSCPQPLWLLLLLSRFLSLTCVPSPAPQYSDKLSSAWPQALPQQNGSQWSGLGFPAAGWPVHHFLLILQPCLFFLGHSFHKIVVRFW